MIQKLKTNESVKYQKLTPEEMKAKGILGRLVGVCADFMNPTRNGRKYSEQLWENVFNNPLMQEKIKNGVCYGELGHPENRTETDLEKIAICLREQPVKNDKGQLIAVFDILDTPCGRILKTLCDYGSKLGISSRGQGDLITDYNGDESVDPDTYDCECWDVVLVPGVETARLNYVRESLDSKKSNLRKALRESLENASYEEKKVMEDTLKDLNIDVEDVKEVKEEADTDLNDKLDFLSKDEDEAIEGYDKVISEIDDGHLKDQLNHIRDEEVAHKEFLDDAKEDPSIDYEHEDDEKVEITLDAVIDFIKSNTDDSVKEKIEAVLFGKEEESDEDDSLDIDDESDEEDVEEDETEEDADDAGEDDVLEQLKEALKAKEVAEASLKELQEKLAVSDSKVSELNDSCTNYRSAVERLSKMAKDNRLAEGKVEELTEEVEKQKQTIEEQNKRLVRLVNARKAISEECEKLKESLGKRNSQMKALTESVKTTTQSNEKETSKLQESFNKKLAESAAENKTLKEGLEKANKIKESYKKLATQAANKYIEVKATMLGLTSKDIKRKLGESYSLEDVDQVCEDLKNYQISLNNLPFNVGGSRLGIRVNESKQSRNAISKSCDDDDVSDSLIHLANL